jgi:hypothetical protein
MLPTRLLEKHLQLINPGLIDIIFELRNLISSVAPNATEEIQGKCLIYYDRQRGGHVSGGICQINFSEDHIRLAFIHGAFLPDPNGLLQGGPKYKKYVRIDSYEDAPWDYLKDLINASNHFDPYTLSTR